MLVVLVIYTGHLLNIFYFPEYIYIFIWDKNKWINWNTDNELKNDISYLGNINLESVVSVFISSIYPTPPLGQDMTQGQFLSGV